MLEDAVPQANHVPPPRSSDHTTQDHGVAALNQSRERRPPHLPFRRISVNYAPKILFPTSTSQRSSVASAISIESLPECQSERHSSLDSLVSSLPPGSSFATHSRGDRPASSGSLGSIELGSKNRSSAVNVRASRTSKPKSFSPPNVSKTLEEVDNKRRKVMFELWETEISYVEGLDLIYSNFLSPLVDSLSSTNPLLSRENLTAIFSNFVDIWNLHLSFRSDLDTLFVRGTNPSRRPRVTEPDIRVSSPPQACASLVTNDMPNFHDFMRILLSHFPYLSMYNPFVTSFSHGISLLTTLSIPHRFNNSNLTANGPKGYDAKFATWLHGKEAEPICRKLKLRDWMLTIIQRCPRYLLLIKDLMSCTSEKDRAYSTLVEANALLAKITTTMNEALRSHAQILSLLSLQRSTQNLPFPLISPGRSLIKRSTLVKVDRGSDRRIRDVLLFSDVLVWLSRVGEREDWGVWPEWSSRFNLASADVDSNRSTKQPSDASVLNPGKPTGNRVSVLGNGVPYSRPGRRMMRTRSRSDADVLAASLVASKPTGIRVSPTISLLRNARQDETQEERWFYRGSIEILDVDVVMSPVVSSPEDDCMLEVLSPRDSFALCAETPDERDSWVEAIRSAKLSRMTFVQATQPNTTLTSSTSNKCVRRCLQALPHDPGDAATPLSASNLRAKVEHFVPAIWIPDQKMEACMRCQTQFGWRLRRHHCRLCGKVVCASCSNTTFYIYDPLHEDAAATPARACNACYDTVFPVLDRDEFNNAEIPRPGGQDVLRMFHPSVSISSLALAVAPIANPLLPSVPSFGIFNMPSFLRSTSSVVQRSSMLEVYSETSTIASSIHTDDIGFPSERVLDLYDETHDTTVGNTDAKAWDSAHPVEKGSHAGCLEQLVHQTTGANTQLSPICCSFPCTRCSNLSGFLRVPEVQCVTGHLSPGPMISPIFPTDMSAARPQADANGTIAKPRYQVVNPSRRTSISPFSPTGPQSSVQDTAVVTQTRSRGDRLHQFTLLLGGTIRARVAEDRHTISFNQANPASVSNIVTDSWAESAVIGKLTSILGRHACS